MGMMKPAPSPMLPENIAIFASARLFLRPAHLRGPSRGSRYFLRIAAVATGVMKLARANMARKVRWTV